MSKQRPGVSKSELEVARILWDLGEATVRQVHDALPQRRKVDFWTVQTYLRRLKEKGYLNVRRVGQGNVYSPAVQPKRVIGELIDDFLERVFDGQVLPLFQQLVESRGLTDEELKELEEAIDLWKGRRR